MSPVGRHWEPLRHVREMRPSGMTVAHDTIFLVSDSMVGIIDQRDSLVQRYVASDITIRDIAVTNDAMWLLAEIRDGEFQLRVVARIFGLRTYAV